jgi:hypothetical protein
MHNNPQPDDAAKTPPADTIPSATQASKDAALPNQGVVEVAEPVASGEASKPQDQGGFVKLDEHGMVLGFEPPQE